MFRFLSLLALWLILAGPDPLGLPFGVAAAALATRASLALLPPRPGRADPRAVAAVAWLALRQAALGGWDIALRALSRDPRLAPGMVRIRLATPAGPARDLFLLIASLAPGSLPVGASATGVLELHALDTTQPLARQMAELEAGLARARGRSPGEAHG